MKQTRSPWLFLDLAFLDGFYPEASATLATSPFPAFLRLGFTSFRAGLAINQDSLVSSLPLSQVTALAGIYLSPEDRVTRLYLGAGGLLRLSPPPGGSLVIDGFSVGRAGRGRARAHADAEPALHGRVRADGVCDSPARLFLDYFGANNGTFPYVNFPPSFAVNILEVRMGLRLVL